MSGRKLGTGLADTETEWQDEEGVIRVAVSVYQGVKEYSTSL
jgi:hypothetical protein